MKSFLAKLIIVALSVLLIVTPTLAEVIYLKDGTRMEGRIERITDKKEVVFHLTSARAGSSFERVPLKWIDYVRVNPWTDISPDSLESILARSEGRSLEEMFAERPRLPGRETEGAKEGLEENELHQRYNSSKLSIELKGVPVVMRTSKQGSNAYGEWQKWTAHGWRKWTGYEGSMALSEEQFFAVAGYPFEAYQAQKHRDSNTKWAVFGALITVGGLAMVLIGYSKKQNFEGVDLPHDWNLIGLGGCVLVTGAIATGVSIAEKNKNLFPYSKAQAAAEDYNEKLMRKLQEEPK